MIKFLYDINKDAQNWVKTVKEIKPSWGINYEEETKMVPKNLKSKILKTNKRKAEELVKNYFRSRPYFKFKKKIISSEIKAIEEIWGNKEKNFFKILEKLTKRPIFSSTFIAYFTTMFICPYDGKHYKWFMLSMWHSLPFQITIICHEIFHFQFLHYYADFCKKQELNKAKIEDIKEALTVLLNTEEFDNIILNEDMGYSHHQILRQTILNIWQENKPFYLENKDGFKIFLETIMKDIKL